MPPINWSDVLIGAAVAALGKFVFHKHWLVLVGIGYIVVTYFFGAQIRLWATQKLGSSGATSSLPSSANF